jgi:acetate---CoA ligase (ADP-forming) subunit beta
MAILLGAQGYKLLEKYKIPVAKYQTISEKDLLKLKFPIVLKAISEKIIHKTEAGAVQICKTEKEARTAFARMKKLGQILAQEFVEGQQIIIGTKRDTTFGQTIMFGLGGIFVEIFRDVSFRVCPITEEDADEMIGEIKSKQLLLGFRNQKAVNLKLLKETLVNASKLAVKENPAEMDINPFIINDKAGAAVDVRIVRRKLS